MKRQRDGHTNEKTPGAVLLYRIDATKRMHRFYLLDVQPDLFGEWCLMREWGRIGSAGRTRSIPFASSHEAQAALHRQRIVKEKRGYEAGIVT
jgi:predicted DNA-binding WGR domain protein